MAFMTSPAFRKVALSGDRNAHRSGQMSTVETAGKGNLLPDELWIAGTLSGSVTLTLLIEAYATDSAHCGIALDDAARWQRSLRLCAYLGDKHLDTAIMVRRQPDRVCLRFKIYQDHR